MIGLLSYSYDTDRRIRSFQVRGNRQPSRHCRSRLPAQEDLVGQATQVLKLGYDAVNESETGLVE
jgi:hypothetical protein